METLRNLCTHTFSLLLTFSLVNPVWAQTPWESAPAKPAPLPSIRPDVVSSLPPPPAKTNPQVAPPPYGSLTNIISKEDASTPTPPPANQPGVGSLTNLPGMADPAQARVSLPPPLGVAATKSTNNRNVKQPLLPSGVGRQIQSSNAFSSLAVPTLAALPSIDQTNSGDSAAPQITSQNNQAVRPASVSVPTRPSAFSSGILVAVVGDEHILAGDLAQYVEPTIEQNRDRIPNEAAEQKIREQIIRQVLKQFIQTKAMYQEFFHDAAGTATPKKLAEMKSTILPRAGKIFFQKQVPVMQEKYNVTDLQGLEEKLRERSMSLTTMKSIFVEQVLAGELERKYVPDTFEVSLMELRDHYEEHKADWNEPAKARWEQLTVRFDKHNNNRRAVEKQIHDLGNEIFLGGKQFEQVARQSSEGYTASEGGKHDWTTQGSLKSRQLDQQLFSIPTGELSQVIADDIGMHIIRVIERTPARVKPFTEAQAEIRETISGQKKQEELKKFRQRVMKRTPVWSLWPEDLKGIADHARPLQEAT
ncbi:MAG: peptidyl-prolyl cis-trans isomerase [Planctomycetota bacterium]|nr:peptidyl-prolyl cis-trans isomerase [Planctomycetota bacterium]